VTCQAFVGSNEFFLITDEPVANRTIWLPGGDLPEECFIDITGAAADTDAINDDSAIFESISDTGWVAALIVVTIGQQDNAFYRAGIGCIRLGWPRLTENL